MLEYARWKYVLIAVVTLVALILALPNFFGQDPALQIARRDRAPVEATLQQTVEQLLREQGVAFNRAYVDQGQLIVRFPNVGAQLQARDLVNQRLSEQHVSALSFASRAPEFLARVGLRPMALGLDLRGGLFLLYQVDTSGAITQLLETYEQDVRAALMSADLRFSEISLISVDGDGPNGLRVTLPEGANVEAVREAIATALPDLTANTLTLPSGTAVQVILTPAQIRERQDYAIQQNIVTLRNRVNELGVSESVVQRQGQNRISVQVPGVQNAAEVKDILGKVATLEFRMEYTDGNAFEAAQRGRAPFGAKLYTNTRMGQPVLLRREVIVTGDQLTNATTANTQEGPAVSIRLDSRGGDRMLETTRNNIGQRMGVVFIEKSRETIEVNGQQIEREVTNEEVISLATIRGIFSNNFQITGLSSTEARELALLLRAGSLAAPIYVVEERVVGPSLGQENIEMGIRALLIGMVGVFLFMVIYYRVFGLVANVVLIGNLILLVAALSGLRAALTLPGIAGIVLTLGMAVDANVLIYERIREELRRGTTPQAAIRAGFDKALSAIADANVTTLIAGLVLWVFGTGPIRGFAVTLSIGILTSMFTAIMGSRAILTLMYGGRRRLTSLPI